MSSKGTVRFHRLARQEMLLGYALVAPLLVWLVAVLMYPLLSTIVVSLHDQRMIGMPAPFVGLDLYRKILFDPGYGFWEALRTSILWTAGIVSLELLLGLGVAVLLSQQFQGANILRSWIIVPWVIPMVVMAIIWRWMLSPIAGVINYVLQQLRLVDAGVVFLGSATNALPSAIAINAWRGFPLVAVVLLGAIQAVPRELHEAAVVDGASSLQRFRFITFPQITPALTIMALLTTLWSFTMFAGVWLLTEGGPGTATTTLPVLLYIKGFRVFRLSEAAALSVIMFLFLILFMVVYLRLTRPERRDV